VATTPTVYGPLQSTVSWLTFGFGVAGPPTMILDPAGEAHVFVVGDDAALWHIRQYSPDVPWGAWESLGGQIDLLAVGKNQDGRLEVFARGANDQALWHIRQTSPGGSWSSWSFLGSRIDLLAVGTNQDGRLEVFARGRDQGLWHIWQLAPNSGWGSWWPLGGQIDLLAVGSNQDGRIEVFARGTDQALWHIWQVAPNGSWGSWASLGDRIDLLSVGANQDGCIQVLVRGPGAILKETEQTAPNNGWTTFLSLGFPMWRRIDPTAVVLFELAQAPLEFSDFRYGDSISGASLYIPLAQIPGMPAKRVLVLDDATVNPQAVDVTGAEQMDLDKDGKMDHWAISFTPDLSRSLATSSAFLYGNVALATHGETVSNEVLGNGDAAEAFQTFRLKKSPVTFVHHAGAPHGAADTLKLLVSNVYWTEVQELYGYTSTDRVFTTSVDSDGLLVQLGDGATGARAPSGRSNIVARYRKGIGVAGNVAAATLTTLLDRPVGLKSATNPSAANGGTDAESRDQARSNAPNTVRTFGRIVSLEDFEDQARQFSGIAKARATSEWSGEDHVVCLTVAGVDGAEIVDPTYSDLVRDLNSRRDPNRAMRVRTYSKVNIQVRAQIDVRSDRVPDDVQAAAQAALTAYFAFDALQFGQPIYLSGVYAALQAVEGVLAADITLLQYKSAADRSAHGANSGPLQDALSIYADELAWIEEADSDITITAGWSPS
jgi:uncharacterized phage protein gp47/JayE/acylphosphatase